MFHKFTAFKFTQTLIILVIGTQLFACGGDSSSSGAESSIVAAPAVSIVPVISGGENTASSTGSVDISGSVGDGPITGATVRVYNNRGELIATVLSDNTATYKHRIKARGNEYPLLLEVDDGIDLVTGGAPDFTLRSVMLHPRIKVVNINPASTLIVMAAEAMPGGLDAGNVAKATAYVTGQLGFGLDTNLFSDPITTPVTET